MRVLLALESHKKVVCVEIEEKYDVRVIFTNMLCGLRLHLI